jgi:serine-type D-Ala-D-Ala carboxypeptidase (penicillin-binding protein 5/6)
MKGYILEDAIYPLKEGEKKEIRKEVKLFEQSLPWENEHIVGKQVYFLDDKPITEVAIYHEGITKSADNQFFSNLISVFKQIFRMG